MGLIGYGMVILYLGSIKEFELSMHKTILYKRL